MSLSMAFVGFVAFQAMVAGLLDMELLRECQFANKQ